jgi:hypothetical protein
MTRGNILSRFSASRYNNKEILVLMCVVIVSLIVDTSLNRIYGLNIDQSSVPHENLPTFIALFVAYLITQYLILRFVKQKSEGISSKQRFHVKEMHKIVTIVQYVLAAIIAFVILEMLFFSYYDIAMLTITTIVSYSLAVIMMGLLAQRFFSWFRSNKNVVVFLYGLSSATVAINAAFTLLFVTNLLAQKPPEVREFLLLVSTFITPGSIIDILDNAFVISSILSFALMWIATSMLLCRRLGKVRYWIMIGMPLAYFLSQFVSLFLNLFAPLLNVEPVSYGILLTLIFTLSKPAGGILFGIAFWIIARKIQNSVVRDYMIISAYGLILLFVSNQAIVLVNAPYPPFGMATISFIGLSSYLVLLGIYSSAISVSEDSKLRQSIRNFAIKDSRLLDSIGTAHMEQEIQKRVLELTKQNQDRMAEESGIQSSLTEEDMKEYLQQVIEEVKKDRRRP